MGKSTCVVILKPGGLNVRTSQGTTVQGRGTRSQLTGLCFGVGSQERRHGQPEEGAGQAAEVLHQPIVPVPGVLGPPALRSVALAALVRASSADEKARLCKSGGNGHPLMFPLCDRGGARSSAAEVLHQPIVPGVLGPPALRSVALAALVRASSAYEKARFCKSGGNGHPLMFPLCDRGGARVS
jgi:hypothetical protein